MKRSIKIIFLFLLFFLIVPQIFAEQLNVDSLKKVLDKTLSDTVKLNILFAIVENSNDDSEWPKYNERALSLAKKLFVSNDPVLHLKGMRGMGDALNNKGYLEDHSGHQDAAIENYQQSILYRQESNDQRGLAEAYNNFASVYGQRGDVLKSLEYHQKSLKIREAIGDKFGTAQSLNNIGYIYKEQGDAAKALEYYRRSVAIKTSIGDKKGIANTFNNIGLIFLEKGVMDTALNYFNESLAIRESIGHNWGIANSLNNIGLVHLKKNELKEALACNEKSLAIREKIKDKEGISFSLRYLSEIYLKQNNSIKAMDFAQRSLKVAIDNGFAVNIQFTSELLYKIYKKNNDLKNALAMHELFKRMQDSLSNEETKKGAVQSQFRYEYEEKETVLKAEEAKKELLSQKEAEKQKLIRNVFIAGFALMLLLSGVIYNGYKNKKKANKTIEEQKAIVEEKQKEMIDSIRYAKRIQESLLPTDKYIERNLKRLSKK